MNQANELIRAKELILRCNKAREIVMARYGDLYESVIAPVRDSFVELIDRGGNLHQALEQGIAKDPTLSDVLYAGAREALLVFERQLRTA